MYLFGYYKRWLASLKRSIQSKQLYYLRMICASKRVRIRCCDSIYTVYLSLCTLSADPNPFRGTHCIKGCLLWSTQYHHLWIGGIDTQSISLPYTLKNKIYEDTIHILFSLLDILFMEDIFCWFMLHNWEVGFV